MKKTLIFLICFILILTGCNKKEVETSNNIYINETSILSTTRSIIFNLVNQNNEISDKLSTEFKDEISVKALFEQYIKYVEDLTYLGVEDPYIVNDICAYNYINFKEKTIKVYMCFDDNLQVESLIINDLKDYEELIDNKYFKEEAVLVGNKPYLNGIITLPKNVENPSVVVMVSGSGSNDMNETIGENKPFKDIAHGLAKLGIASIRFDKRTYAFYESMDIENITVYDEYFYDVSSAIHMLEKYDINPFKIYYLGHSLGGMLSFSMMYQHPELKGAIILAGSSRKLEEIIYDQVKNDYISQGLDNETIKNNMLPYEEAIKQISELNSDSKHTTILNINSEYWNSLNENSFERYKDINDKYLILQGEKDVQVYYETDFELLKEEFKNNKNVTLKSYENLNHLFMNSISNSIDDYNIKSKVDEKVIEDIADWINGKDILKEKKK
ncbi:MAG: alpha/beta hydrolase [Erysipelotrichaceae bacterium]|nr:alpha/beta hydrolase [Erysipelotrichaceae bacterium]